MAELDITVLQVALGDKTITPETVTLTVDALLGEENPVITSVTPNVPDTGVSVNIGTGTFQLTGAYVDKFAHGIKWSENQPADHSPPTQHASNSWSNVPLFGVDPFDFLFAYLPPDIMTTSVTYTVVGTYDLGDPLLPAVPPVETPFTGTVTQEVQYDTDNNVAEFKKRLP